MFTCDKTFFPLVIIKFKDTIESDEELQNFEKIWLDLYEDKKEFIFLFDTSELGYVNVQYCYKLKKVIDKIRSQEYHYLRKSIIIVSNVYIKHLLTLIFNITKPVATVYIYNSENDDTSNTNKFYIDLLNLIENNELDKFKIIKV